ncbi:DUF3857 domain-containing protein [Luteimonas sp. MJ204]|uniref:DUF3857 domain-containing protein n=1 Tax=Luteimonas sp. MJ145 TaxID=3129234 RepID=UPI0031BA22AC
MMRWFVAMACLLAPVVGLAGDIFQRGDFEFGVGPEPAYVERVELPVQWDASAPGHDEPRWRYWWHDTQADRRGGRDQVYVEHAYEPRAVSQLGEGGRFQATFNPEYQRLEFHRVELRRDGRWLDRLAPEKISLARRESGFERDLADGLVTALVVLDDVRVGDVVRIAYSVTGSNPVLAGQMTNWTQLAWRSPMLGNRLRVLFDPGTEPAIHREHTDAEPVVIRHSDAVEVLVSSTHSAPVHDEGGYPAWYQPYPQLQVAPSRTWADVVAWALPLYPRVDALPADLEQRLGEWSRIRDPLARATAATRAVQDEVRYFGVEMGENTHRPNPPALTWDRRYGDCKDKTYLLVTLLRRLGVEAEPALVSVDRGKAVAGFVPSASNFDHVIVRARISGEVRWIDPTLTYRGGQAGDTDLTGYGMVLPLVAGVAAMDEVGAPAVAGGVQVRERYVPEADAAGTSLEIETVYRGTAADDVRGAFATGRLDEMSRRYADYYRRRFGELDALDLPAVSDDRAGNVITVLERYRLRELLEPEGAGRAMDTWAESLDSPSRLPQVMDRKGPIATPLPGRYRHEVEFHMPDGWSASFGRESDQQSAGGFDYRRELEVAGGVAAMSHQLDVARRDVQPEEVPNHVGALRKVRDGLSGRLRFQLPAAQAADERRRRLEALLENSPQAGGL